ncbi:nucleoside-diphosphate-sugar epimerase [Rhodopseudomonas thermotolerans]|uniref:Nucleoside-diphosphate-sugar epimerase n=2 Tax=Rhodopseudomonas TaxID=1073 RepID=A0A336JIB2_9BRAD|nr:MULTISPECIES: D-erythronate dehydrogenase [Rhodopseudomonas]RED42057.1 nucleoside-diphosphate-sugar epimerase [Rhodopseudomonas pentothenatexigens]REG07518.1 nucleoside-diphosphate-sugar epimerase [Rhodopseudomonas thermotolerans]SSW89417.1 nucleoside-diphosphate-sugar epimerase [Rhodopseudomonas pentothenatexigens]
MHILILGAAGMVGRKLTDRLLADGRLGSRDITRMTLQDVVAPARPPHASIAMSTVTSDLAEPGQAAALVAHRPEVIFHLAAIVSGEAEADFDKGYRINLDGTRHLIDAIRAEGDDYHPRLVFTSSIAVFGVPFPEKIGDEFLSAPLTSYGTQKAICELLIADYTRKGFFDGVGIRLPTICVRPGKPNKAASGFFSNIIREPLAGQEAVLPVGDDVMHWHASPRSAVGFLIHAATMDTAAIGPRRSLSMPGLAATVGEQIAALQRVAGKGVVARIKREPDPTIIGIVSGWPRNFATDRALKLGFTTAEQSFDDIIRIHIEDELGGTFAR